MKLQYPQKLANAPLRQLYPIVSIVQTEEDIIERINLLSYIPEIDQFASVYKAAEKAHEINERSSKWDEKEIAQLFYILQMRYGYDLSKFMNNNTWESNNIGTELKTILDVFPPKCVWLASFLPNNFFGEDRALNVTKVKAFFVDKEANNRCNVEYMADSTEKKMMYKPYFDMEIPDRKVYFSEMVDEMLKLRNGTFDLKDMNLYGMMDHFREELQKKMNPNNTQAKHYLALLSYIAQVHIKRGEEDTSRELAKDLPKQLKKACKLTGEMGIEEARISAVSVFQSQQWFTKMPIGKHSSVIVELIHPSFTQPGKKCNVEISIDNNYTSLINRVRTSEGWFNVGSAIFGFCAFPAGERPPTHGASARLHPLEEAKYKLKIVLPVSNLVTVLEFLEPSFLWGSYEATTILEPKQHARNCNTLRSAIVLLLVGINTYDVFRTKGGDIPYGFWGQENGLMRILQPSVNHAAKLRAEAAQNGGQIVQDEDIVLPQEELKYEFHYSAYTSENDSSKMIRVGQELDADTYYKLNRKISDGMRKLVKNDVNVPVKDQHAKGHLITNISERTAAKTEKFGQAMANCLALLEQRGSKIRFVAGTERYIIGSKKGLKLLGTKVHSWATVMEMYCEKEAKNVGVGYGDIRNELKAIFKGHNGRYPFDDERFQRSLNIGKNCFPKKEEEITNMEDDDDITNFEDYNAFAKQDEKGDRETMKDVQFEFLNMESVMLQQNVSIMQEVQEEEKMQDSDNQEETRMTFQAAIESNEFGGLDQGAERETMQLLNTFKDFSRSQMHEQN